MYTYIYIYSYVFVFVCVHETCVYEDEHKINTMLKDIVMLVSI